MTTDTPIYDRLSAEYLRAGKPLPWIMNLGRYKGQQVRILDPMSTGIHPTHTDRYLRDYLIQQRYATVVCNGRDNCPICNFFG